MSTPAGDPRALARALLTHYRRHRRALPWRDHPDAYAVWISEVMLQQTRVETVRPYFTRFLQRFPTLPALAAAPLDDVLQAWAGLGYYARARTLHRAAGLVVERHAGRLPADAVALRALPGFGPYTTAAVGSIALGLPLAAVDGNVARVFARLTATDGDPRLPKAMAAWQRLADALLPREAAGDFNQALMELGATICTPGTPDCARCPIRPHCRADAEGRAHELPPPRRAKARPTLRWGVAFLQTPRGLLWQQRAPTGLFAGLWELPSVELEADAPAGPALLRHLRDALGVTATIVGPLATVAQTLTHRELVLEIVHLSSSGAVRPRARTPIPAVALAPADAPPGGISSAARRALEAASAAAPTKPARAKPAMPKPAMPATATRARARP